jgi:hypothetical protein
MHAFVEHDLPGFDSAADFTACAWILSDIQSSNVVAFNIECVELSRSLMCIGEWDRDGRLQAFVYHGENLWLRGGSLPREQWLHVAVIQSGYQLLFYVDGRLENLARWRAADASETATRVRAVPSLHRAFIPNRIRTVTQLRICLGRSAYLNKPTDQWKGAIENAKLWSRSLSEVSSTIIAGGLV